MLQKNLLYLLFVMHQNKHQRRCHLDGIETTEYKQVKKKKEETEAGGDKNRFIWRSHVFLFGMNKSLGSEEEKCMG